MEISNFRHRSSGDFLGLFSSPSASASSAAASILSGGGHELLESDILWQSGGSDRRSTSPISRRKLGFRHRDDDVNSGILAAIADDEKSGALAAIADGDGRNRSKIGFRRGGDEKYGIIADEEEERSRRKQGFRRRESFEILADDVNLGFRRNKSFGIVADEGELSFRRGENPGVLDKLHENSGILADRTSATPFRPIPKPQRSGGEFAKSAPIKVPPAMARPENFFSGGFDDVEDGGSEGDEEEMLPPHEIVAMKLKTTSSVLEGVGRTLKGRDLRQVRNAVWQQTGFID